MDTGKWLISGGVFSASAIGMWMTQYLGLRNKYGEPIPQSVQEVMRPYFPELDLSKVKIVYVEEMPVMIPSGVRAFTPLWNLIIHRGEWNFTTARGLGGLANELTHIRQWKRYGFLFLPKFLYERIIYGFEGGVLEEESTNMGNIVMNDLISQGYPV